MSSKLQKLIEAATVAIALLIVVAIIYAFLRGFIHANPAVQASITAGLVALFTLVFTFWKERRRAFEEVHRDKKIEAYGEFFDLIFKLIKKVKEKEVDEAIFQKELEIGMFSIMRNVMAYGSPDVVLAFSDWKVQSHKEGLEVGDMFRSIGRVLLAMRRDIGLSNKGLNEINIHQIYIQEDVGAIFSGGSSR